MKTIEIPIAGSPVTRPPIHEIHTLGEFTEPANARAIVLFAIHVFEGAAAMENVARLTHQWLNRHVPAASNKSPLNPH